MNSSEYHEWMKQAFLMCEGALAMELATETRLNITEEHLRSNLVRGDSERFIDAVYEIWF